MKKPRIEKYIYIYGLSFDDIKISVWVLKHSREHHIPIKSIYFHHYKKYFFVYNCQSFGKPWVLVLLPSNGVCCSDLHVVKHVF